MDVNRNETTLRDYIRILFRHQSVILTSFFTVTLIIYGGLQLKTKVFEASVKMLIAAEPQVQSPYYRDVYGESKVILTQSEIVKSKPVLERTVKALGLDKILVDYEKTFYSPIKKLQMDFTDQFKKMMGKAPRYKDQQVFGVRGAMEYLRNRITITPIRDTNLFTITVQDFSPSLAAETANVISRSYVIFDLEQQLADLAIKYGEKHPATQQLSDNINKMVQNLNGQQLSNIDAIGAATVKIIEQAEFPLRPVETKKRQIFFLGAVMSLFMGVILAFIIEFMDPNFKSPSDIDSELNLPLLGSISRRKFMERLLIRSSKRMTKYTYLYQNLSDQLYLLINDKKLTSILFTAVGTVEGTSAIVANTGVFLSQKAGHKVLLIDGNFRNPQLHKILKIKNSTGFGNVLEGKVSLEEATQGLGLNFDVLPSGKTDQNPVVLFDSPRFKDILQKLKTQYEIVLMDCPNLKPYKDAAVLAGQVDGTVVVISEGQTRRKVLKSSIEALLKRNVNLLGIVLNHRTFPVPEFIYERV